MKKIFNNKKILYFVLGVVAFSVLGATFLAGYYVASNTIKPKIVVKEDIKTKDALKALQKLVDENQKKEKNSSYKMVNSEVLDYKDNFQKDNNLQKDNTIQQMIFNHKPKLVIIMDDMSFHSQVESLKKLNIPITPSFFPASKRHPNTPIYAKQFKHYMVHFPMQAMSKTFPEEEKTLHIDSSYNFILNRVIDIKKEFPEVKFVNNHTGSKFTSNLKAMKKLYMVLNKENMIFVDSRTTSKTKAPLLSKKYNQILLSRNVFLDNKADVKYIQKQLKDAVYLAKKRGYAIAICHPHSKTFEALSKSKKILNGVEVIYIDELYRLVKTDTISRL